MALAIFGVLVVFLVTLVAAVALMRFLRRATGEPADPDTESAAATITTAAGP